MVNKPSISMARAAGTALFACATVRQRHQLDAIAPGGQREPAVLQRQRVLAEDVSAPARQRADRRVVIGRDGFEIIGRGDQLLGDMVILAALLDRKSTRPNSS